MAFCSSCGTKLQEGDVFCIKCGARVDGASPTPVQAPPTHGYTEHATTTTTVAPSINTEAFSKHAKQTMDIILGMLMKPVAVSRSLVKAMDQQALLVTAGVLTLVQALLSMWKLNQFISSLGKIIGDLATSLGSIMSFAGGGAPSARELRQITEGIADIKKQIDIPYGLSFLHGIIFFLVIAGLLFLGLFLVSKMFSRTNVDVLTTGKLAVLATIPFIGGQLLSIILSYISNYAGLFILVVGILISFAVIVMNLKGIMEIDDDKMVFALSVLFTIVVGVGLYALGKFISADVNSIIKSAMNVDLDF